MICPKCGAPLDDDAKFCESCGAQIEMSVSVHEEETDASAEVSDQPEEPEVSAKGAEPTEKKTHIHTDQVIGLIVGTVLIVIGITRIASSGTSLISTSFGGDFYTYTYQGIVAITHMLASLQVSLGWIIVAIGAAIDVMSIRHWGGMHEIL